MKTKAGHILHLLDQILFEVPGWPDAPRNLRVRRALPILVPCVAILLLLGWNHGVRDPHIASVRASHADLHALESDIAALRLSYSEAQASDLTRHATRAAALLVEEPRKSSPTLQNLHATSVERGWEGNYVTGDASGEPENPDAVVRYLPVRAKLTPAAPGPAAFPSLLALLEQFSTGEKRIDLTRLAVRADEQGRYTAEVNLRLACSLSHAQVSQ